MSQAINQRKAGYVRESRQSKGQTFSFRIGSVPSLRDTRSHLRLCRRRPPYRLSVSLSPSVDDDPFPSSFINISLPPSLSVSLFSPRDPHQKDGFGQDSPRHVFLLAKATGRHFLRNTLMIMNGATHVAYAQQPSKVEAVDVLLEEELVVELVPIL